MAIIWVTPPNLGSTPENQYYELQLATSNNTSPVTYTLIAGTLPGNLSLASNGTVSGNVALINSNAITSNFTVRASESVTSIADRTFSLSVNSTTYPNITPASGTLTSVFSGAFYSSQFSLTDSNLLPTTTFSLGSGSLPPNVNIAANGLMSGLIPPSTSSTIYTFEVIADTHGLVSKNSYNLTVSGGAVYDPYLITPSGTLANITQGKNFAYQIQAIDYNDDALTYAIQSGSLPAGISLDANTGWITGIAPSGNLTSVSTDFTLNAYKTINPSYVSNTNSYTFTVLGQSNSEITWITDSDLGSLYNGEISDIEIVAIDSNGVRLVYSVITNIITDPSVFTSNSDLNYGLVSIGGLPAGLELLNDGSISGRPSFEMQDDVETYIFTVSARDTNNLTYSQKEFTLRILRRNDRPYENLNIQILPNRTQRDLYNSLVNNTDIIPSEYVYRPLDPWFGRNTLRRVLFMTGLNPLAISDYIAAMQLNHYWKSLKFGDIKTAKAYDDNLQPLYEVVYVELIDQQINEEGVSPNLALAANSNNVGVSTVYPNSFPNMTQRLADGVNYQDRGILPRWMTTRQDDGTVLGFVRALVLCYTLPNYSAEVAYRISNANIDLKLIDFTVDRYEYDSILSDNFIKTPVTGTGNITANTSSTDVTGNSTVFLNELQVGSILYVSNSAIGNVATITSNTALTLDANSSANVANLSYTYGNSFVVINYTTGTGTITANTSSNVVTGNTDPVTGSGTITGANGNATITGTDTSFTTEMRVGANIYYSGNSIGVIKSIISSNTLSLLFPLTSNISNVAYTADGITTLFTTELHVGDVLVNTGNVVIGTVDTISNNYSLTLTTNSAIAVTDEQYAHTTTDPYTVPGQGDKYLKFPQIGVL